jgi:hypothetical protein
MEAYLVGDWSGGKTQPGIGQLESGVGAGFAVGLWRHITRAGIFGVSFHLR